MVVQQIISPQLIEATKKILLADPFAKKIDDINEQINDSQLSISKLETELAIVKSKRPPIVIKWRRSIEWCLEVDSQNKKYFLKNSPGVCNCIAFKHKVDLTPDIKNKIATTLSMMFRDQLIGRLLIDGTYYYGLPTFFEKDLKTLKKEYLKDVKQLIL